MTQVHWVLLLAVAAVLVNADANFATDSKLSLRSDPSDVYFNRFLRVDGPDDEERAGVSVSILEKAKALFGPSVVPPKLVEWLTKGKPAKEVFVRLGLNKAKDKLFEAPQFLLWAKYVDGLSDQAPGKGVTMIPTLTAQYGDEALTQMINAAKTMTNSEVKKVATKLQTEQFFSWLAKKKAPDETFNLFKLNKAGDDLLSYPQLTTWTNYLRLFNQQNPDKQTTLLATMVKSYGDAGVAKILQEAMKVPETAASARRLDTDLVRRWLASEKSTDEVFALLNLDTAGDKLFSSPLLVTWTKYMNAFNQKNPDKQASLAATLAAHYGDDGVSAMLKSGDVSKILADTKSAEKLFDNPQFLAWLQFVEDPRRTRMATSLMTSLTTKYGDEALIKMIEAAMKVQSTKLVATKLQTQQFQHWAAIGKSPDDVFKLFMLNKAGDNLLSSPQLETWKTYLKVFNQQNPKEQTTLIASMTKSYGDEAVLKILEAAKNDPLTAGTAKRLESEQMQRWLKMTPDEVFKGLNLDTAAEKMFGSSQLNAWGKYAGTFNSANPDKKTSLIGVLTTHYGDDGVISLLEAAKKVPGSEAVATRLQTEQLQRWLSNDKPPHEIFPLFQLDKAGDKLFASPQFNTWIKYTDDFANKNIDKKSNMIATMRYYYDDDVLAKMILAAEKNPSTKKIAQRADEELMKGWIQGVYTPGLNNPDEVFQSLKLDQLGEKVLESPLFGYFSRYVDHYNKANRGKEATMISALTQRYEDEALTAMIVAAKKTPSTEKLATKLQAEQIHDWLIHSDPPDELFNVLKLDVSVDNLLTHPNLNTWAAYLQEFNAKYPPSQRESMIDIFRASFGDRDLAKMLIAAKEVPSTKKIATDLQTALFSQWVLDRSSPAAVSKVLSAGGVAESTKAKLLAEYSAKFKETYG